MDHPFGAAKGTQLTERVVHTFTTSKIFETRDRHLVFVCGGSLENPKSLRKRFLDFAASNLPYLRTFLAEAAQNDLFSHAEPRPFNLATFERILGSIADCIVLFVESEGSLAELGYFSAIELTRKRLLVVNSLKYQGISSFVNDGPLAHVLEESAFRPPVLLDFDADAVDFSPLEAKLKALSRTKRRRFEIKKFEEMSGSEQIFLILQLILTFRALNVSQIAHMVRAITGSQNIGDIGPLLSILVSAGYVMRSTSRPKYLVPTMTAKSFLDFEGDGLRDLILEIGDHFQKYSPENWEAQADFAESTAASGGVG